jgi:flagellar biosynthesis chaperone FliJ
MEMLRRHQFEDYQQLEARQEQRRLDDLFLLRRAYLQRS